MQKLQRDERFLNRGKIADEAIKLLKKSIQFETINPPGNEIILAEYYKGLLEKENFKNISYKIIETGEKRGNLIITLKGIQSENRPIWGFASHLDVVSPGNEELWTHPPFSGEIIPYENDHFIWGRGAMDMKFTGVAMLIALFTLMREGFRPKGDIRLIFESDEEISGYNGILPLIKEHWSDIKVDIFITEGGGIKMPTGNDYTISVTEKGKSILKITALGATGHGSMPGDYNKYALFHLNKFLNKLQKYKLPKTITEDFKIMINSMSLPNLLKRLLTKKIFIKPLLSLAQLATKTKIKSSILGLITPTIAPTIMRAGEKENVISPDAYLILDVRMIPGQDNNYVTELIKKIAGEKLMKHLKIEELDYVAPTKSTIDTPEYALILETLQEIDPKANLIPLMLPAGTDARRFRMHGKTAYGFSLMMKDKDLSYEEMLNLPHSPNERISVTNLMLSTEYYYRLMKKL